MGIDKSTARDENLLGNHKAKLNGKIMATARNPNDRKPKSLMKLPLNVCATTTPSASSATIDSRVCSSCEMGCLPLRSRVWAFTSTSRTRMVAPPRHSPLPQPRMLISSVPSINPPNHAGRWLMINEGKACDESLITPMPAGSASPARCMAASSSAVT